MKSILISLAFVSTLAFGQGVPLLSPATKAPTAAEKAERASAAKLPGVVKMTSVSVNRHAIDSNAITVTIDGKEHRFVGTKSVMTVVDGATGKSTAFDTWAGTTKDGASMTLGRGPSQFSGSINTVHQGLFELKDGLLIQRTGGTK